MCIEIINSKTHTKTITKFTTKRKNGNKMKNKTNVHDTQKLGDKKKKEKKKKKKKGIKLVWFTKQCYYMSLSSLRGKKILFVQNTNK